MELTDPREMENGEAKSNLLQHGAAQKETFSGLLLQLKAVARCYAVLNLVLVVLLFVTVIILVIVHVAQTAKTPELSPAGSACWVAACPDSWIGYMGKCYYFSEPEANCTDSQKNGSALRASLAGISSQQEIVFLKCYKDSNSRYWIGLWREPEHVWKWVNGTEFNHWFPITGGDQCAFLNDGGVGSSSCSGQGRQICSKPARKPEGRPK